MAIFTIDIDEAALAAQPEGLVIGTDPELCDIVVPDPTMAPRHARLRRIEGRLWLEDLNGGTGSWVDGVRLHPFAAFPCRSGATLRLGEAEASLTLRHGLTAPAGGPAAGRSIPPTPPRSRRRVLAAAVAGLLLVTAVVAVGIGFRYYRDYQADAAAWRAAAEANTEEAYRAYLQVEPEGRYVVEADAAIARIAEERIAADDALYQAATERDTVEGYREYLVQLPEGRHLVEAQDAIARLEQAAAEAAQAEADAEAWRKAESTDSRAAYQGYLDDFPQGAHVAEARERMAALAGKAAADAAAAAAASEAAAKRRQEEAAAAKQRAADAQGDWEDARRRHSFEGYSQFLEKHPNAPQAPEAMNHLGYMYANAEGVPQDYAKALDLFRKAAAGKNPESMLNLGYHYHYGLGVAKDPAEAASWYRKAIDAGNRPAASLLRLLQRETGVP